MKKKNTYRLPCHTRAEDCEAPPKKRELKKSLGALLVLMMLFMFAVPEAKADLGNVAHGETDRIYHMPTNNEQGYIEIRVPWRVEAKNNIQHANEGSYVGLDENGDKFFHYCQNDKTKFTIKTLGTLSSRVLISVDNKEFTTVKENTSYDTTDRLLNSSQENVYVFYIRYYPSDFKGKTIYAYHSQGVKNGVSTGFDGSGFALKNYVIDSLVTKTSSDIGVTYGYELNTAQVGYVNITATATLPSSIKEVKWEKEALTQISKGKTTFKQKISNYNNPDKVKLTYYWVQDISDKPLKAEYYTANINNLAYHQPSEFEAKYKKETGQVDLTWKIDNTNKINYIKDDGFEIQASIDEKFEKDPNIRSIGTVLFDINSTDYSITDNVADLSNNSTMYYRIRRTHIKDKWAWNLCSTVSVALTLADHAKIGSGKAVPNTVKSEATITWSKDTIFPKEGTSLNNIGYWSAGTKLVIEKRNVVTGGVVETFELTKEEWKKGSYVDDAIIACVSYSYRLQIKPGNTVFAAAKAVTAEGEILVTEIGELLNLKASKGYYPDRVSLQWNSKGKFDQYIVRRTLYGKKSDTVQIALVPASASDLYTFDDDKNVAGTYYTYIIQGMMECGGKKVPGKNILTQVGFRSPQGNIYGSATYENGQAVKGVEIRLEQDGNNIVSGSSMLFSGNAASGLSVKNMSEAISSAAFTFQTWIKPTDALPANQILFSAGGQYEIGFDSNTELYVKQGNVELIKTPYKFDNSKFVHISVVRSADSVFVYAADSVMSKVELAARAITPQKSFFLGSNGNGKAYKGHMDEVRIWNRALTQKEIEQDHRRLITGNEKNLIAYYRLDEIIDNAFYDISYKDNIYNENHGEIKGNAKHDAAIPDNEQLSLKGITNESGNYFINGVPYTGNGTQYKIIPRMGTHQFDPTHHTRFVGGNSLSHEANFKDKSSFPVSGHVYYSNTTVPVQGVMFKIDGLYANDGKGNVITTDDVGAFKISVPVGYHEVKAEKTNHKFEDHGRITDSEGKDLNYQKPMVEKVLRDATTIRFIGRIGGGAIQEAYPLGHSLSTNNLGDNAKIEIELEKNGSFTEKTISNDHFKPKDADKRPNSSRWKDKKTTGSIKGNKISLNVDKTTGEFVVDLIPEKFKVTKVETKGHTEILKNPITIDFTDKLIAQQFLYEYVDSVEVKGKFNYFSYSDTVSYNESYKFIKRVTPELAIDQLDRKRVKLPYFGTDSVSFTNMLSEKFTYAVYNKDESKYVFGEPVFTMGTPYVFKASAFESYKFNGNGKEDNVPTADGILKINNGIRAGAIGIDEVRLDDKGEAIYTFTAGEPNLSSGLKDIGISVDFSGQSVAWKGGNKMKAYVLGSKSTGNDFVTDGPEQLITILRDPPGSNSYAYLEKGATFTSSRKTSETFHNDGSAETKLMLGAEVTTGTGIGVMFISTIDAINEIGNTFSHQENKEWGDVSTSTTTISDQISTSSSPDYVGDAADLLIGNSTNITYGISESFQLVSIDNVRKDGNNKDVIVTETNELALVKRNTLSTNVGFKTLFAYPLIHIESVLMPNLTTLRDALLMPKGTANGQNIATNQNRVIYVSKLDDSELGYGKSNNDKTVFENAIIGVGATGPSYDIFYPGGKVPDVTPDSIHFYNQSIKSWINLLAQNEQGKIEAEEKLRNYSFHAASGIEHSREYSYESSHYSNFEYVLSSKITGQIGFALNNAGIVVNISEEFGGGRISEEEKGNTISRKEGFVLAEDGSDYISVDVLFEKNPIYDDYKGTEGISLGDRKGPFVYRTKGGVTSCPYEGGYISKYYKPGTVISEPTLRMEVPKIGVDKSLVKNVPSNRKAVFKLMLENQSESRDDMYYNLNLLDKSNPYGATLSVDGIPLGNNGRAILVPYGEVMEKTLEVARGPQEMNYNDLQLILASQCQYNPTDFLENIADTVFFSAHFIPSCSEIQMKTPLDKWIINTDSKFDISKNGYILPIVLDQFDLNNSSLERFEIQVKQEDESVWTTQRIFYLDPTLAEGKSNAEVVDMDASEIKYDFVMNGMADSRYDVRAVSICKILNDEILTYSDIVSGTKDTQRPTLFGSVQPANGILDVDNEVLLNFNEIIKEGALTRNNFTVTGIRNGSKTDHGVSVLFDGVANYIASEAEKNLSDKDLTIEMWVFRSATDAATLFSHGNVNESIEFGFNANNQLEVRVGASAAKSSPLIIQPGQWAHVAMVYKAETQAVDAYYNFVNVINDAAVAGYRGQGNWELGRSIKHGGQYFAGQIHEMRVWTKERSSGELQINSMKSLTGSEAGLLIYYPMSEGKGEVAFDKARGANGAIHGQWKTPEGKAIAFDGTSSLNIASGSTVVIDSEMDYTLEFWFKANKDQTDVALITNELKQGEQESFENRFFVGFNKSGKLVFRSNGNETVVESKNRQDYRNNVWHHFAASINRISQKIEIYVDEEMISQLRTDNVGGIGSDYITVGAKRSLDAMNNESFNKYFKGSIDEIRVWNTSLNDKLISKNSNIRLNGQEMGLLAYYPFEEWIDFQNNKELKYTLKDMKVQKDLAIVVPAAIASTSLKEIGNTAPIKDRGPVENLSYSYVVSDKSLLINLEEVPEVIEKSTVTFSVDGVQDMFGNKIKSPITWSAYIDRNLLKWSEDQLNLTMAESKSIEFKVDIINNGGKTEKYSIENLPKWLTAIPDVATVNPKSKQTVVFTIDEGLNVGSYSEVIYMLNSNNVTEAMALNVKVEGEKPNWSVDPGKFEYNMSVYGQLRVSNIFSKDKEDIIAAFVNNECVGLANNTYHAQSGRWFTFLTVYGNETNANAPIEFRIWDASTGKTFAATTTESVIFKNQQIYGTSSNPLIFDTNELYFQNFKLNKGWNWISFNVSNNTLSSVQSTLGRDWKSIDIVKNENRFDSYSVNSKQWVGTLSAGNGFNNSSMYMLKSTDGKNFSVVGSALDLKTTAINITGSKWNYISYLPTVNMKVNEALAGYDALDGDVIKSQESFAMFDGSNWVGSLNYLEPNRGYMLRRVGADNTSFKYPTIQGSLRSVRSESADNLTYRNYNHENNMTVVAEVIGGVNLRPNDRILAYLNGELRGRSIVKTGTQNELYFMNVVSDEVGAVKFAVERDGEIIAKANNAINYGINHVEGSIDSPLRLNFETSVEKVLVYPNPFKSALKINVSLDKESKVEILVHNINGSLVKTWKSSMLNEGQHEYLWNASAMSTGVYIIIVKIDDNTSTYKVIKQ